MKKIIALTSLIMLSGSTAIYAEDLAVGHSTTNMPKSRNVGVSKHFSDKGSVASDSNNEGDASDDDTKVSSNDIDMDKVSRIIGHELGEGFKSQDLAIAIKELEQGLQAGLSGKPLEISEEERRKIMQDFQQQRIKKAQMHEELKAKVNTKFSDKFMAAIEKLPIVKKAAEGVYYQIIKNGSGKTPKDTDTVTVEYTGTTPAREFSETEDGLTKIKKGELLGEEFDSSKHTGKPAVFPLDQLISCWTDALSKLPVGTEAIIYCSPKTAYGEMAPSQIGPNQVLSFKVNLLKAEKKAKTNNSEDSTADSDDEGYVSDSDK